MPVDISVSVGEAGRTTAAHYPATENRALGALLVLAHGAGAGQQHPFMVTFGRGLAAAGIDVVTFNFLYTEQRRRVPDKAPALEHCFRRVIDTARDQNDLGRHALFIGGKSMGGRIATHLAAEGYRDLKGVVVLGYPLHPPGTPERRRAAHLPSVTVPVLIVQGERDTFGTPAELAPVIETMRAPVALHVVAGGDHSLTVRGRPREQIDQPVLAAISAWIAARSAATA